MLRAAFDKNIIRVSIFPLSSIFNQASDEEQPNTSPHKIYMEKFKDSMWDENGNTSKEVLSVLYSTFGGAVAGFILGGTAAAKNAVESFKKENQATLFENTYEAQRRLQSKAHVQYLKGGLHFATKLGLFCFLFSSTSTAIYIYREKFHITNYIYGGAITGFLYKMNMGIKGAFSGTLIGSILGIIYGACAASTLWMTGCNLNKIYEINSKIANARREQLKKHSESYLSKERNKVQEICNKNEQLDAVSIQQKE